MKPSMGWHDASNTEYRTIMAGTNVTCLLLAFCSVAWHAPHLMQ
jgi:hypothetical protein